MKRYFTLLELLITVAIIGILVTLLMPSLSQARERAREAVCLSNERQLGIAFFSYSTESGGFLPAAYDFSNRYSWDDHLSEYMGLGWSSTEKGKNGSVIVDNWQVFSCPSNDVSFKDPRRSYAVNTYDPSSFNRKPGLMGDDVSVSFSRIGRPNETLMAGEQWRTWNKLGSESAQNSGYGYSKLKYEAGSGWWKSLKCHDNKGRANLLMADGSAFISNGKILLDGSFSETGNKLQGSWLDHAK